MDYFCQNWSDRKYPEGIYPNYDVRQPSLCFSSSEGVLKIARWYNPYDDIEFTSSLQAIEKKNMMRTNDIGVFNENISLMCVEAISIQHLNILIL